ncbi:MAG TPA: hypothetical protein VK176_16675 [Phycisphaerales bacterium]|nr:hypothetical protein [Phycisphaerales bacterium]
MNRSLLAVATLSLLAGAAQAEYGPNLLNNAGFESPLGFDFSDPSNWNGFFGGPAGTFLQAFNDTGATPHGGDNALVTTIRGVAGVTDGFNAFTGHVQIVSSGITPGQAFELAVWARANPVILDGAEFRVEWQDASGAELARTNVEIYADMTSDYQRFAFESVAPAGAARAAIVLAVQSFYHTGVQADTSVAWDDASFRSVPTPGAAAVLGMGVLAIGRRRR